MSNMQESCSKINNINTLYMQQDDWPIASFITSIVKVK